MGPGLQRQDHELRSFSAKAFLCTSITPEVSAVVAHGGPERPFLLGQCVETIANLPNRSAR